MNNMTNNMMNNVTNNMMNNMMNNVTNDVTNNETKNIDLLNFFLSAYNKKYNDNGNMFARVDTKDPTSTNDRMELFYEYMTIHKSLVDINPELCDCCDQESFIASQDHEIYALVVRANREIHCVSHSYISLLSYIYDQLKGDHSRIVWNIVKL